MQNIPSECIVAQTKKKKISLKRLAERLNSPIDEVKDIVDGKKSSYRRTILSITSFLRPHRSKPAGEIDYADKRCC